MDNILRFHFLSSPTREEPPEPETPEVSENYEFNVSRKRKAEDSFPTIVEPFDLKCLQDILNIAWYYRGNSFDWFRLWKLVPALEELNGMIGMDSLKKEIIDFIIYQIQELHSPKDMLHCVLYGPPGSGKTTLAGIMSKIYCGLGFLSSDKITMIRRSDLIGKFVGHTEAKTEEVLKSAIGGVIFIDEAYSLGEGDVFSKTAIDIINRFLGEHSHETVCIIAGYEKELNDNFFSQNPGLERRFPWKFHIEKYSALELKEMFLSKVRKSGWKIRDDDTDYVRKFFQCNHKEFKFSGGDIDILFSMVKIAHARRIFGTKENKKVIVQKDIDTAFVSFQAKRTPENDAYKAMFS